MIDPNNAMWKPILPPVIPIPPSPPRCPWCGLNKKIYLRAGSELVCVDCAKTFQASEGSD